MGILSEHRTALRKVFILTYKQGMNQGFPSINPWLLQLEGRAQVLKLIHFLLSPESREDIIHWHSYEGSLFKEQRICELLHDIISLHLPWYSYVLAAMKYPNIYAPTPVWGKEIFIISLSLPTDDSSCSLLKARCLPSMAPWAAGRAGGGTPSPAGSSAPTGAKGAGAHTDWKGLTAFREVWNKVGRRREETNKKIKGRNEAVSIWALPRWILTTVAWPHAVSTDYKQ